MIQRTIIMGAPGAGKSTLMRDELVGHPAYFDDVREVFLRGLARGGTKVESFTHLPRRFYPLLDELIMAHIQWQERLAQLEGKTLLMELPAVGDYPLGQNAVGRLANEPGTFFIMLVPDDMFLARSIKYRQEHPKECYKMAKKEHILRILGEYRREADRAFEVNPEGIESTIDMVSHELGDGADSDDIFRLAKDYGYAWRHLAKLGVPVERSSVMLRIGDKTNKKEEGYAKTI